MLPTDDLRVIGQFLLADGEPAGDPPRTWIQVMITGKDFVHARYGKFSITENDLELAAADIQERADKILIDFDHESAVGKTKAAGWYTGQTEIKEDGQGRQSLFAEIEFTPSGAAAVRSKEYRFISPEFAKAWRDSMGKLRRGLRMFATALTNRPFLPDMDAVTLSDLGVRDMLRANLEIPALKRQAIARAIGLDDDLDLVRLAELDDTPSDDLRERLLAMARHLTETYTTEGDSTMNPETLKLLGLPEDASDEQIAEATKTLAEKAAKTDELQTKLDSTPALEDDAVKKFLASDNPGDALRALITSAARGEEAAKELHTMRRDSVLDKALAAGKVLPAQLDAYRAMYDADPENVTKLLDATPEKAFDEVGHGNDSTEDGELSRKQLSQAARRFESEHDPYAVDDDSLKLHLAAEKLIGKADYTSAEYVDALERVEAGEQPTS